MFTISNLISLIICSQWIDSTVWLIDLETINSDGLAESFQTTNREHKNVCTITCKKCKIDQTNNG